MQAVLVARFATLDAFAARLEAAKPNPAFTNYPHTEEE
jgi:hypothetical protein